MNKRNNVKGCGKIFGKNKDYYGDVSWVTDDIEYCPECLKKKEKKIIFYEIFLGMLALTKIYSIGFFKIVTIILGLYLITEKISSPHLTTIIWVYFIGGFMWLLEDYFFLLRIKDGDGK